MEINEGNREGQKRKRQCRERKGERRYMGVKMEEVGRKWIRMKGMSE